MQGLPWTGGLLVVFGLAGAATGTSVMPVPLRDAVVEADAIVQARVDRVDVGWGLHQGEPAIVSRVWLADEVVLKGRRLGSLQLFGGALGEQSMTLEGQPELRPGEQVFLFVLEGQVQCPFVGVWQGVYRVEQGRVARQGRPVVDVVDGEAVLARDHGLGMRAASFAAEVQRLVAQAQPAQPATRIEVALEQGRKTLRLSPAPRSVDPHGHLPAAFELARPAPKAPAQGGAVSQ